ncbi:MAG: AbrB/MazE/SpoVT family DNA-binding domain-containing protein [Bacteroidales bacterium]|nr:AbrB/MazE/SpoVT family DNA-binding domain-containing protein [Bacteroidales bacterium]
MKTSIIKIGNSKGLIIPSSVLKDLKIDEKDRLELTVEGKRLVVRKEEEFTGPFTGPFARLVRSSETWGGDVDAAVVADALRKSRKNKETGVVW